MSGDLGNVRVNDVDVTAYVEAELDRRFQQRIRVREMRTPDDYRATWDVIERHWALDGLARRAAGGAGAP